MSQLAQVEGGQKAGSEFLRVGAKPSAPRAGLRVRPETGQRTREGSGNEPTKGQEGQARRGSRRRARRISWDRSLWPAGTVLQPGDRSPRKPLPTLRRGEGPTAPLPSNRSGASTGRVPPGKSQPAADKVPYAAAQTSVLCLAPMARSGPGQTPGHPTALT